jgi:SAM-dependent methyltransferase
MERMPVEDGVADLIVCEEGMEHMPNQLQAFREFNRALKPGGSVLITTPSISNLRGRFSHFLTEAEIYHRLPPNALDSLWHSEAGRQYFGHAFLIGIQRMRTLAAVSGFELVRLLPTRVSWGSVALGFMYPLVVLATRHAYRRNMRKNAHIAEDVRVKEYGEVSRLITSPTILFGKELFVEFRKHEDWTAVRLLTRSDDKRIMDAPQVSKI